MSKGFPSLLTEPVIPNFAGWFGVGLGLGVGLEGLVVGAGDEGGTGVGWGGIGVK